MGHSSQRHRRWVFTKQRNHKDRHVGDRMLITAGNKGEQVSEDNNTFRRVVQSPSCHPQGETDQPVTKHTNGEKLRVS